MNANELADCLDIESSQAEYGYVVNDWKLFRDAATMLRQQAEQIESLKHDGKILMQHIADINEDKKKLRLQKDYIFQLEQALESSINLNKAQAERHERNEQ